MAKYTIWNVRVLRTRYKYITIQGQFLDFVIKLMSDGAYLVTLHEVGGGGIIWCPRAKTFGLQARTNAR